MINFDRFELPTDRLSRCAGCRELVETVDSHTHCADCAEARLAADEAEALAACGCDLCDAERAELDAWCDERRAAFLDEVEQLDVAAERPLPHQTAA